MFKRNKKSDAKTPIDNLDPVSEYEYRDAISTLQRALKNGQVRSSTHPMTMIGFFRMDFFHAPDDPRYIPRLDPFSGVMAKDAEFVSAEMLREEKRKQLQAAIDRAKKTIEETTAALDKASRELGELEQSRADQ